MLSHFSRVRLFVTLCTIARQASLSMGFSRQESWSGLPFPSPGDLPDWAIKPTSLTSPAWAGWFFTASAMPANIIFLILKEPIPDTSFNYSFLLFAIFLSRMLSFHCLYFWTAHYSFLIWGIYILVFQGGADGNEASLECSGCKGLVWSLSWEDSPRGGNGNPLQYSCLEKFHEQRSLVGYSPWGHNWATEHTHIYNLCIVKCVIYAVQLEDFFYICICPFNHYLDQAVENVYHPKRSICVPSLSMLPPLRGKHDRD